MEGSDRNGGWLAVVVLSNKPFIYLLFLYISAIHMHACLQIIDTHYSSINQSVNQSAHLL